MLCLVNIAQKSFPVHSPWDYVRPVMVFPYRSLFIQMPVSILVYSANLVDIQSTPSSPLLVVSKIVYFLKG